MVNPLGWCSWSRPWDRWCRREAGVLSNDEEWGQEHGQNRGPCRTGDIGGDSMLKLSHQQDECMSWDFRMESKFFWVLKSLLFISQESALISLRAFSCGLYLFLYTIWKRIIWSCLVVVSASYWHCRQELGLFIRVEFCSRKYEAWGEILRAVCMHRQFCPNVTTHLVPQRYPGSLTNWLTYLDRLPGKGSHSI